MANCEYVRRVCRLGLFALIFSVSQAVFGQDVSGYLEYQGRRETREEGGDVTGNQATLRVDADTPLGVACVIGCAVQTGVGAVLNTARVEEGATVLIMGLGGVGLSAVQGAQLAGAA